MSQTGFNWDKIPVKIGSVARPAAGANFADITVPAGKKWLFLGETFDLVTDGTGANRYPSVLFCRDGTLVDLVVIATTPITAGISPVGVSFNFASTQSGLMASNGCIVIGMGGPTEVPAGGKISSAIYNIQAGDRPVATMRYVYKEAPA